MHDKYHLQIILCRIQQVPLKNIMNVIHCAGDKMMSFFTWYILNIMRNSNKCSIGDVMIWSIDFNYCVFCVSRVMIRSRIID